MSLPPLLAAALLWPAVLLAAPADPVQPKAEVPPFIYKSAFASYQSMKDEPQTPDQLWRTANDTVGRIGGHAGYLSDGESAQRGEENNAQSVTNPAALPHHHVH